MQSNEFKNLDQNLQHDFGKIQKEIKSVKKLSNTTLGLDIDTLASGGLLGIVTVPTAIITNAVAWKKTGKMKDKLRDIEMGLVQDYQS